ncbi:MAG: 2-C-methyl-D-erythritol 2,4-cyclodiphosphate synthase [Erysipelotrichaceae bacterium]|nr:2-C-methyl-D-erythritol 2,4-cyclodiphosphate synthase [Erysipelotrichaceae bacterium]
MEEWLLNIKVGIGYDVHQLIEGRKLILGGVEIPHSLGLLGHSDADVLTHAIMDALLGAAGLGDIGRHFPETEQKYKGISSLSLLKQVMTLIAEHGFVVGNVDAVIAAQRPKLAPYMEKMTKLLAETMAVAAEDINLKATTTEHLGFEGREEGISVTAVCLLNR